MNRQEMLETLGIDSISTHGGYPNDYIDFHYKNSDLVSISILDRSYENLNNVIDEYLNTELSKLRETKINYLLNE